METINIKNKQIKIKDGSSLLVEKEVSPETIQFVIQDADQITDVENLSFYIQFWRSSTDSGKDNLTKTYNDGVLYLNWYPSASATNNDGKTKLQIVGYKESNSTYSIRWATKICEIEIAENLEISATNPTVTADYLATNFGGSNE